MVITGIKKYKTKDGKEKSRHFLPMYRLTAVMNLADRLAFVLCRICPIVSFLWAVMFRFVSIMEYITLLYLRYIKFNERGCPHG